MRRIIADGIPADQVTEALISSYLYTGDLPDPDLIIRTSGELRVSNFLIWQGAYSEYYATPTYWPDFDEAELKRALVAYGQRKRRFGMTDEQLEQSSRIAAISHEPPLVPNRRGEVRSSVKVYNGMRR